MYHAAPMGAKRTPPPAHFRLRVLSRPPMRPKAYPLEAARTLRSRAHDEAVLALSQARTHAADAIAAHERAQAAVAALEDARTLALAPASAAVSGAELARSAAYAHRLRLELDRKRAALAEAAAALRTSARAVRLAELKLSQAYIEREVIERHHARFAERERKRVERAEEAELDDLIPHLRPRTPTW